MSSPKTTARKALRAAEEAASKTAATWLRDNRDTLEAFATDELRSIARGMAASKHAALGAAYRALSPAEFVFAMTDTADQLRGIARRRAALIEALNSLGVRLLRTVGRALLTSLGATL